MTDADHGKLERATNAAFGDALRSWALRRLGVPCGAHGSYWRPGGDRWCRKPFGHRDSCAYVFGHQPLFQLRRRRRGWRDDE